MGNNIKCSLIVKNFYLIFYHITELFIYCSLLNSITNYFIINRLTTKYSKLINLSYNHLYNLYIGYIFTIRLCFH